MNLSKTLHVVSPDSIWEVSDTCGVCVPNIYEPLYIRLWHSHLSLFQFSGNCKLTVSTEEIRRSGRATKGQHTKNVEDAEPEPPKRTTKGKASKGKAKKVEASPEPGSDEDEGFVRCICGATEEDEDEDISWVACDKCGAWQHTDCMGLTNTDFEGKNYFCEQCRPQDHKELLVKIKRGEKPWEQARQRQEEKKQKKGKRGRKSKASEVQQEPEPEPVNIAPVAEAIQVEGLGTGGRQKRKLGDDSPAVAKTPEATVRIPELHGEIC